MEVLMIILAALICIAAVWTVVKGDKLSKAEISDFEVVMMLVMVVAWLGLSIACAILYIPPQEALLATILADALMSLCFFILVLLAYFFAFVVIFLLCLPFKR